MIGIYSIIQNKRTSALSIGFVFLVFFFIIFCNLENDVLNKVFNLNEISNIGSFPEGSLAKFLVQATFRFSLIILPMITLTIVEVINNIIGGTSPFSNTSIGRISFSKGYKYADLWFWSFGMLTALLRYKFTFFLVFFTLGTSRLSVGVEEWFNSLYVSALPSTSSSQFVAILIILIAILLTDLSFFIDHYLSHYVPFLWDLHEIHHSPTEMTIFSASRGTDLIASFTKFFTVPFSILSGLLLNQYLTQGFIIPVLIYIFFGTLRYIFEMVGHSSYQLIYPKPISYIFMSPSLHWIHHSSNPKHYNKNIGGFITLWDRIFGTYLDETHIKDISGYGVKDTQYNKFHPIYAATILPLVKLSKRIKYLIT